MSARLLRRVAMLLSCLSIAACFDAQLDQQAADLDPRDAGTPDASTGGPRHALCDAPLEAEHLRGAFVADPFSLEQAKPNAFAEVDCQAVTPLERCTGDQPCPFPAYCLHAVAGEPGYCVVEHPSEAVLLSYRDGLCVRFFLETKEKAALCCANVPGVDCRTVPFEERGGPGMFCASTTDCEAGLVCRLRAVAGEDTASVLGTCQCPEAPIELQGEPALCADRTYPQWGRPSQPSVTGACEPALAPGFVHEVITSDWPPPGATGDDPQIITTHSGEQAFIPTGERALLVALESDMSAVASVTKLSDYAFGYALYDLGFSAPYFRLAFDAEGALHVLRSDENNDSTLWTTRGAHDWAQVPLPKPCAGPAGLSLDGLGRRHVLCVDDTTFMHLEETDTGWSDRSMVKDEGDWWHWFGVVQGRALFMIQAEGMSLVDLATNETLHTWDTFVQDVVARGEALAVSAHSEDESGFHVYTGSLGGEFVHAYTWSHPYGVHQSHGAALALTSEAEVALVHRTPEGMGLTRQREGTWQTTVLIQDDNLGAQLRLGPNDEVRVYYGANSDWSEGADELRRVRQGSCSP